MRTIDEAKLNEVYEFILSFAQEEQRVPSLREIARACDYNSTSWVSYLIAVLADRGLVEIFQKGGRNRYSLPENLNVGETRTASFVGSCPCGEPVLAVENIISTVALPVEIFGDAEHIILRAKGRSMIKRGIFDGDLMIVRLQPEANVGDVVIARVNDEEATAKILAKRGNRFYLKPANDEVDEDGNPIYRDIYPKGKWDIVGVVDNVIHRPNKEV